MALQNRKSPPGGRLKFLSVTTAMPVMLDRLKYSSRRVFRKLFQAALTLRADMGYDPYGDMRKFVSNPRPILFDVGANVGQTMRVYHDYFPGATIYSFEPSPTTFKTLERQTQKIPNAHAWNCGIGSVPGKLTLIENDNSDMSSFLKPGERCWGNITQETVVDVCTVDEFCREHDIGRIDVLKSDTQASTWRF